MEKNKIYSKQLREFIGKPPSWTLRSGTTIITTGFVVLLVLSSLIDYNDIIVAKVVISSKNPPVKMKSRYDGELENVFIEHGEKVRSGQILAEVKNPANFIDVFLIKDKLEEISFFTKTSLDSLSIIYPQNLELGPIQNNYNNFFLTYQEYILNDSLKPLANEGILLSKQIDQEKNLLRSRQIELKNFNQELSLSNKSYQRSKSLYDKGVISKAEFEKANRSWLSDRQKYESLRSKLSESEINIIRLRQDSTLKNATQVRAIGSNVEKLKQSIQTLKSDIQLWEEKYILSSPIDGTVNLFDNYSKFQNVEAGETLFTVFPIKTNGITGTLQIPVLNSGKVTNGQRVLVKLENYPHYQYGYLDGKVTGISGAPDSKTNSYRVFIELDSQITSQGQQLDFNKELLGTAEIITEKLSLLQRLFYGIRKTFSRNIQPSKL